MDKKTRWLDSDSFVKRAFAVYGYVIAATLMVYGFLIAFVLVIAFFGALLNLL